jgi:uncharacterized membrane protein YphA (DoxX/SURF4 family)
MIETRIETTQPDLAELPLVRALFTAPGLAWVRLVARVYLGWQWLQAGIHKLDDPAWVGDGSALPTDAAYGLTWMPARVLAEAKRDLPR